MVCIGAPAISDTGRLKKKKVDAKMRALTILLTTAVVLFGIAGTPSRASWLIDAEKFHGSAHGQIACTDCHSELSNRANHPNPADVNKKSSDFFSTDHCLNCHDDVSSDLSRGIHGSDQIPNSVAYQNCISCHHPHYSLRSETDPIRVDTQRCSACHENRTTLPLPVESDRACVTCHLSGGTADQNPADKRTEAFCFHCHTLWPPVIQALTYGTTVHAGIDCMVCHPEAGRFEHGRQIHTECRRCHRPHDEKKAHDVHAGVACGACHLQDVAAVRIPGTDRVSWQKSRTWDGISRIHDVRRSRDRSDCRRCHFNGNLIGASAVVLPPKSILCMPCHAATLSAGDAVTVGSVAVFAAGILLASNLWFSGSLITKTAPISFPGTVSPKPSVPPFRKVRRFLGAVGLDVLLQRRLYRRSKMRWLIHGLIFFPLVARFAWGAAGLLASLWAPNLNLPWMLLDRNHPLTALFFDGSGLLILFGLILAFFRGRRRRQIQPSGLPGPNPWALGLIGGIVAAGFLLEGVRIAMTGFPVGSAYAFFGYAIAALFAKMTHLTAVHGVLWYAHAVLCGVFLAVLPFSRMLHILAAPVVLIMNAAGDSGHGR